MIPSVVGKTFLKAYNEAYGSSYDAKQFFNEVYWNLFYNHKLYMQWITNSPFVQMRKGQKPHLLNESERLEKLAALHGKVNNNAADASFALGFPASELKEFASTSGLVSDIHFQTDPEDVYLSWIGSGLGVTVAGGYTLLFDDPTITISTFQGWKHYRRYLNDENRTFRGNQINTWNGQWLAYRFNEPNDEESIKFRDLEDAGFFNTKDSVTEVATVAWPRLFFSLSQQSWASNYAYVYSFGQMNKTLGFIPFEFAVGSTLKKIYHSLYGGEHLSNVKDFDTLFGLHIKRACELGSIGLLALKPQQLSKLMRDKKAPPLKKEEDFINYRIYKTWLIAMLSRNKEELLIHTMDVAKKLHSYRGAANKTTATNNIKSLFEAPNKQKFISILDKIMLESKEELSDSFLALKNEVHLMTREELQYFSTLIQFDYNYIDKTQ